MRHSLTEFKAAVTGTLRGRRRRLLSFSSVSVRGIDVVTEKLRKYVPPDHSQNVVGDSYCIFWPQDRVFHAVK